MVLMLSQSKGRQGEHLKFAMQIYCNVICIHHDLLESEFRNSFHAANRKQGFCELGLVQRNVFSNSNWIPTDNEIMQINY